MRPRKLRRLYTFMGFGAILAGSIIGTGLAKADSGDLVTWASDNGYTGTAQAVIIRGSLVCADLSMGDTGEQASRDLWLHTGIADLQDARLFVIEAVDNLCPQFDSRGTVRA